MTNAGMLQACLILLASASMSAACFCTGEYNPFCGPNGKQYGNMCAAICELGGGGVQGGYLGECGSKTTTKKGGTANAACAVKRVGSEVTKCTYDNGDTENCRAMTDGQHSTVAMRGTKIKCAKLPLTIEIELDDEVHVETITMTSDWFAKRFKATKVNALLHAEEDWHPVSFDNHEGFRGRQDYSCGDGVTMFGGMQCCYPLDRCNGGKAGSFHNISVSVVTDKLQIVIAEEDGKECNNGIMLLDEILVWSNKPKCQDRCPKDCSGTDRGTCTPFAIDGKLGDVLLEGPDEAQYACVCRPGYTGRDCGKKANCNDEGFPFCEASGATKMPSGTECKPDHDPVSTKVYVAHNDKGGCGYGVDEYIDPCIEESDLLQVVGDVNGASGASDISTLLSRNSGNLDAIMKAGVIVNTKKEGCCPSNRMRLTETLVTSETCYKDFWAFQCMAACEDSCCLSSTSTTLTSSTTTATTQTETSTTTRTTSTGTGTTETETTSTFTATTVSSTTTSQTSTTVSSTTTTTTTTSKTATTRTDTTKTKTTTTDTGTTTTTATDTTTTTATETSTTTMMDKTDYLQLDSDALEAIGKTIGDMIAAEVGFTPLELSQAGFSASDIAEAAAGSTFTPADLKLVPGMTVSKLKRNGFTANDVRAAGYSEDQMAVAGYSTAEIAASKAFAPAETSTTTIIIVVAVVLVLAIVIAAVVVAKNRRVTGDGTAPPSFENPMYADNYGGQHDQHNPAYMDPQEAAMSGNTGYMDVTAPQSGGGGGALASGYMDVAPPAADGFAQDSDDEEV